MNARAVALCAAYVATIAAANYAVAAVGAVPLGFGLTAPAGVAFAGLAFTLRDLIQDTAGRWPVAVSIAAGVALAFAVAPPELAAASAVAFGVSEVADWLVYEPLRRRRPLVAVAASNVAGLLVDSWLFLAVAFGSLAYLPGQIAGKAATTAAAVVALAVWRKRKRRA